jgi:hypothetical protein
VSDGLETRVRELEVEQGRTSMALDHINDTLKELVVTVHELRDTMNQGKGAIRGVTWLWGILAGAAGAVISWAMTHFSQRP